jgi:hypothetical protein
MPGVKAKSGGGRRGAGRKTRAELYARPIRDAENRIADRLPFIIDKLFELGEGIMVQEQTENGPRVYAKPPDRQSLEYLANRVMGKPTENVDLTSGGASLVKAYHCDDVDLV